MFLILEMNGPCSSIQSPKPIWWTQNTVGKAPFIEHLGRWGKKKGRNWRGVQVLCIALLRRHQKKMVPAALLKTVLTHSFSFGCLRISFCLLVSWAFLLMAGEGKGKKGENKIKCTQCVQSVCTLPLPFPGNLLFCLHYLLSDLVYLSAFHHLQELAFSHRTGNQRSIVDVGKD